MSDSENILEVRNVIFRVMKRLIVTETFIQERKSLQGHRDNSDDVETGSGP